MGAPAIVMGDKITGQCAIHMIPNPWCGHCAIDLHMLRHPRNGGSDRHDSAGRMRRNE